MSYDSASTQNAFSSTGGQPTVTPAMQVSPTISASFTASPDVGTYYLGANGTNSVITLPAIIILRYDTIC